jgi:hypothetical protein
VSSRRKPQGTIERDRAENARVKAPEPRLQPSDFGLSNEASRPVQSALIRAFVESFLELAAIIENARALANQSAVPTHEAEVLRVLEDANRLAENVKELSGWVYPPRIPMAFTEAVGKADALNQAGLEPDRVEQLFRILRKRPVGAPAKRRQSFIGAFEFMLESKKHSQGQATRKFCSCGKQTHDPQCEHNLKAGVRGLKEILRKYAPELVNRYDSLHPDRAKKVNG